MAIWSIMAAPLILSVDLRTISDWARAIILNENLIAINQDPLGIMGKRILQVIFCFLIFNLKYMYIYS
jgi:alpha-N-acetylgalactosaminidase